VINYSFFPIILCNSDRSSDSSLLDC